MAVKKLAFILNFAVIAFVGLAQFASAQNASEEPLLINRFLANKSVTGAWQINAQESDNVLSKVQEKISNLTDASPRIAKGKINQTEAPSLSLSLFPPDTLILAADDKEKAVIINEGFKDMVMTRTVFTDGTSQIFQLSAGANVFVKASQQPNKVLIETVSPRGNKMLESYELANNGEKLHVTVRVETSGAKELLTLHRVYDRAAIEIPMAAESGESY